MAKYLLHGSYSAEGVKGIIKDGGSKRRELADQLVKSMGGTIEAFYFAYGENDFYVIIDNPDSQKIIAGSLLINASGAGNAKLTVLITPEEMDEAAKIAGTLTYRPPGQ
jgi:uncharacterized protein with GYD domain